MRRAIMRHGRRAHEKPSAGINWKWRGGPALAAGRPRRGLVELSSSSAVSSRPSVPAAGWSGLTDRLVDEAPLSGHVIGDGNEVIGDGFAAVAVQLEAPAGTQERDRFPASPKQRDHADRE